MKQITRLSGIIPEECAGQRLDQALAQLFADYSRSRLALWLKQGQVNVEGRQWRGRDKVRGGEQVEIEAELVAQTESQPEAIALDIRYEDEHLIIINKPAGLVVHPAAGNASGTLLNALLYHEPQLATLPRAGIVHRLDKDTSGLLVVARSLTAQKSLVEQLQARSLLREYIAIVNGVMTAGGRVEAPVGRHPVNRKRMAVTPNGKPAVTHYRVLERYRAHTAVRCKLESGRTHQIRVHMGHIRYPLLGDPVYGGRFKLPPACPEELTALLRGFGRQALHATRLGLVHPASGKSLAWRAALPEDMQGLQDALREDAGLSQTGDRNDAGDDSDVVWWE